jgi:hypothetical protein
MQVQARRRERPQRDNQEACSSSRKPSAVGPRATELVAERNNNQEAQIIPHLQMTKTTDSDRKVSGRLRRDARRIVVPIRRYKACGPRAYSCLGLRHQRSHSEDALEADGAPRVMSDGADTLDRCGRVCRYGCAIGPIISWIKHPQVERIGQKESLSLPFCRCRASRPE